MSEHKVKTPNKPTNSIVFKDETGCDLFAREDGFYVSGDITQEQAQALLDAHNPVEQPQPTVAEKLARAGVSIDDLKAALGL
jgi:hypothetical protein